MKLLEKPNQYHLYDVKIHVKRLEIATRFPCSFYLGLDCGKKTSIKSDEMARNINGIVQFEKALET